MPTPETAEKVAEAKGTLYIVQPDGNTRNRGELTVVIMYIEQYVYTIDQYKDKVLLFSQVIEDNMNIVFRNRCIEWLVLRENVNKPACMRIEFTPDTPYKPLILAIAKALIEISASMYMI